MTLIVTEQDLCELLGNLSVMRDDEIACLVEVLIIIDVDTGHALFRIELFDRTDTDIIELLSMLFRHRLSLDSEVHLLLTQTEKEVLIHMRNLHINLMPNNRTSNTKREQEGTNILSKQLRTRLVHNVVIAITTRFDRTIAIEQTLNQSPSLFD